MGKPNLSKFAADPLAFFSALKIPAACGPARFGGCMADFQRERFAGIAPALLAVAAAKRPDYGRYWWEATKGASKDSDLACCLLWLLAFSKRALTCQAAAADLDQADELRKAAKDVLRLNPWLDSRIDVQSWKLACKPTGSECAIIAADVSGSHGARPDVLICNELSHVTKQEFMENLADNAAKVPHGLMVVATNAGFGGTWQEKWRRIAESSDRWRVHVYSRPSPWLDDAELDEAQRRNSAARFNRLFWGVWSSQSGDALDSADILASVDSSLGPMGKERGWFYVGGLDLGIKHDHSALVIVAGRHDSQQLRLAYAESWAPDPSTGRIDLTQVENVILSMDKRFGGLLVLGYDPYQAALLSQRLARQRVKTKEVAFVGKNLNEMASTMLEVFRSRRLAMYDHKALVRDLGRLTIVERSYGYRLEATRDRSGHADLSTALAIALPLAVEHSGKRPRRAGAIDVNRPAVDAYDSRPAWQRQHEQMIELARGDREYEQYLASRDADADETNRLLYLASRGQRGRAPDFPFF